MRRRLKISAWVVGAVGVFMVVLGGAVWVAGNTDSGRALIERLTYQLTAGHVKLSGLGGGFPMQLTLRELQLSDGSGVWLTADRLPRTPVSSREPRPTRRAHTHLPDPVRPLR